jgi:hypothetical protein
VRRSPHPRLQTLSRHLKRRKVHVVTLLAETASHSDGLAPWLVAVLTFGSIIVLAVVLQLMTLIERKRHPHV